jgi:preprotein translocase subunit SecD
VKFTKTGTNKLFDLTKEFAGQSLAIVVNDLVLATPLIVAEICGGSLELTGGFLQNELHDLAAILHSGNFKAKVKIKDEVRKSVDQVIQKLQIQLS